jgi:hypothetical protein
VCGSCRRYTSSRCNYTRHAYNPPKHVVHVCPTLASAHQCMDVSTDVTHACTSHANILCNVPRMCVGKF